MEKSLADYIYTSLDSFMEITPNLERNLNALFDILNAREITVEEYKSQYGITEKGSYVVLQHMVNNARGKGFVEKQSFRKL